jgi:hypothetical protein
VGDFSGLDSASRHASPRGGILVSRVTYGSLKFAYVFVGFYHIAGGILNANHGIVGLIPE